MTLPGEMTIADEVSIAAGDRFLIMDTTGEVPEDKLLKFYMEYVERTFQRWWESEKQHVRRPGSIRAMQEGEMTPSKPVKPPEPVIVRPQPELVPVTCAQCGGQISWDTTRGLDGLCPHCGAYLRLIPGGGAT